MAKKMYEVECSETRIFSWTLHVEADSLEEAEEEAQSMYDNGDLHGNGADSDESESGLQIDSVQELESSDSLL